VFAVVLQATPTQLQGLQERLEAEGVPHRPIVENDAPYAGELLAIGIQPDERSKLKKYFSKLTLLR
jgi:peptidyl-tRNA hydrolase